MKKLILSSITLMIIISLIMPVTVQAATLSTNKSEMKIDDIVEVKVTMDKEAEAIQFDMQFDNTKYEYVNNSATSKLDSTASNLISDNTVRVSAFNLSSTKAKEVTLKFKATSIGLSVPFKVLGTIELGENGEKFENPEIKVRKISSISKKLVSQYYDEYGNIISRHPQTGEDVKVQDKKTIGTYKTLVDDKTIAAYALSNSDMTITVEDIKAEFGNITTKATNPIKTGDEFEKDGITYTVIIYGDVNKDGRVTTLDALAIKRYELGKTKFDKVQIEAADVENNVKISEKDALEVQKFILGLRVTNTDTVIDRFPAEEAPIPEKLIEGITKLSGESMGPHYCYDTNIVVATITSNNDVPLTEDVLNFELEQAPNKAERKNAFVYENKGNGIFEIRLYATEPGEYIIKPIVSGSAVKNGVIELETIKINVEEYFTVTEVKLFNPKNEDVTNNLVARENKHMQREVRFYHTYTNREGKEVYREITNYVDVEKVNMTSTTNHISEKYTNLYNALGITIVYDENGNYVSGQGPIDYISIQGATVGTDTITIKVNNDDGTVFTKAINVTVDTRAKIQSIIINDKELKNGESGALNLYTYNPNLSTVKEDNGKYYTILPIQVRDEDGDIVKIIQSNIGKGYSSIKDGKTAVLEIATEVEGTNNLSRDIAILKKYSLNENNEYQEENTKTQNIDAIGIAFNSVTEESKANLEKGIEIDYEGISGRERIKLDVTIIEEPQKDDTENKDEEDGNQTVENNVDDNTIEENTTTNNTGDEINNNVTTTNKDATIQDSQTTEKESNIVEDTKPKDNNTVEDGKEQIKDDEQKSEEKVVKEDETKVEDTLPKTTDTLNKASEKQTTVKNDINNSTIEE